jgi:glycosyltransferase involved in cell wall biosynthesis
MSPLISVVFLCYNHEEYVKEAIESILAQTIQDFELIVVDDGSTDRTADIVRSFANNRIRFVSQKNHGPGHAGGRAISMARGKYIAAMSGDDRSMPSRFEHQIRHLESTQADISFCRPKLIDSKGRALPDSAWPIFYKREFTTQEELYRLLFFKGNFLCATSAMFRRTIPDKYGWVHCGLLQLQDYDLWVRLAPQVRFYLSDERVFEYRIIDNDGNLSHQKNKWRDLYERTLVMRRFFEFASPDFIKGAFPEIDGQFTTSGTVEFDAAVAKLFLLHKSPSIRRLGIERLVSICERLDGCEQLADKTGWTVKTIYEELRKLDDSPSSGPSALRKLISFGSR